MISETPPFWWRKPSMACFALIPFAKIYGLCARRKLRRKRPPTLALPVLCIGNFTLGGSGKTPLTIAFANEAKAMGIKIGIVSRGTGGAKGGLHLVDVTHDRARDVGDEPLLLARHAPVVIGVDRLSAAKQLQNLGCDMILMDDGFQSRRLYPDFSLLVVDAARGIGNGHVFPAGPLRAPITDQLAFTDALLILGQEEGANKIIRLAARQAKPISTARLTASASHKVAKKKFLAFAGIGHPQRFFRTIEAMGGKVIEQRIFADHHFFSPHELQNLSASAAAQKLWLATTAKDYIRIATSPQKGSLKKLVVFDIEPAFDEEAYLKRILQQTQARFHERMLRM